MEVDGWTWEQRTVGGEDDVRLSGSVTEGKRHMLENHRPIAKTTCGGVMSL